MFRRARRPRDFGWYATVVKSNGMCPNVAYSTGEEYKPKVGHVILAPFGSSSSVIPRFCICGSENGTRTSSVPSTSTQVEHGGFVGNWIMQHSRQDCVRELANTKDLLQRQKNCCNAIIQRMSLEPSDCLSWSNRSYPNKDPKQRMSDGRQDPRELTSSTLKILNCATQWCLCKLNQNPQSNWSNRPTSKDYRGPLQKIFQKLKIPYVNWLFLCLLHFLCLLVFSSQASGSWKVWISM